MSLARVLQPRASTTGLLGRCNDLGTSDHIQKRAAFTCGISARLCAQPMTNLSVWVDLHQDFLSLNCVPSLFSWERLPLR